MAKKKFGEYYLGLDIGTSSVGWAVTKKNYEIEKINGKRMWGIRLFDESKTAEERRIFRSARRRLARRHQRINLLQELFAEEICKVDPGFYLRLKDSFFYAEDKNEVQTNTLFNDKDYTDKDYNDKYPTIYHLRKALIEGASDIDIRELYLAIHHILKHRGHFLFEGQKFDINSSFGILAKELEVMLREELNISIDISESKEIERILKDKTMNITNKKKELSKILGLLKEDKPISDLLAGAKVGLEKIFKDDELKNNEINKICFKDSNYENNLGTMEDELQDKIIVINKLKAVYDWGVLAEVMDGENYLSYAKVRIYDEHKSDLKITKRILKSISKEAFDEFFKDKDTKDNYVAYIGNGKKMCSQEELCAKLNKIIGKEVVDDSEFDILKEKIDNKSLLSKQVSKDNSTIPYQLHNEELKKILENAKVNYKFLSEKDETGFSVAEKILSIMTFRIPYYVGPLNDSHKDSGFAWIIKKSDDKIKPWNFENVVDLEKSAEEFILRMTNKCTYLIGADVLPKDSLYYSKFKVLNELNNLRINGEKVSVEIKQKIFHELFEQQKRITGKRLKTYLLSENIIDKDSEISGFDIDFKGSLASYIDMKSIIGNKVHDIDMVEDIIKSIVLFGDDRKLLKTKISKTYSQKLTKDEIKKIAKLSYSGWGRISKEFLNDIEGVDKETGEYRSILRAMYENSNNPNLMQLLSNDMDYSKAIKEYNEGLSDENKRVTYEAVEELYVSPSVKRSIWQTLSIVNEIKKITGHSPNKIFVEMARGKEETPERKASRKSKLLDLYKSCEKDTRDWASEIDKREESKYKSTRLYLYYLQQGRCMYSGEKINIEALFNKNIYDIDHIYPQSRTKDDSLDNKVLVLKTYNAEKKDNYPIRADWQKKQYAFWKMLKDNGYISKKKYERLTRKTQLTNDELASFIARQIVETRQSTKAVAKILEKAYDDSEIVYVKAGNVSQFRHKYDFIKSRDVNDYHHAKDAYLNIVVGNVYNVKFTKDPANFILEHGPKSYNLDSMFKYNVKRGENIAWVADDNRSMKVVKKEMKDNRILFTRQAIEVSGGFYDQMILPAGKGQMPIKTTDERLKNINRYGGYNKVSGAYFYLVEHTKKDKRIRSIEFVPVYLAKAIDRDENVLLEYAKEKLEDPKVLIKKIRINSLFDINGFRMHLSGRTGNQLIFKCAMQLILDSKEEMYIKRISNYLMKCADANVGKGELTVTEYDRLNAESNLYLYTKLIEKLSKTQYAIKLSTQSENLKRNKEKFTELPIGKQSTVISEILNIFKCSSVTANLKLIDEASRAGLITLNSTKLEGVSIINQSVTGIFENRIVLSDI